MAADDRNDEPRALRKRVRELEQRFDTLSTKIEDSNGRQWSVSKLVSEFGLTRRQGIGVLGLLAVGVSLPGALTQIAMAGTDEAGLVGSANSPQDVWIEDIYDKNDNAVMELPGDGSVSIDDGTIGGDPILGGPSSTSSGGVTLGGGWTTVDANQPVLYQLWAEAETDGTSGGVIVVEVDESGGTTADYSIQILVDATEGSGAVDDETMMLYLPAGAQIRIVNNQDPNSGNRVREERKAVISS